MALSCFKDALGLNSFPVLPLILVIVYATFEEIHHPVKCWKNYSERSEIWILLGPMLFALLVSESLIYSSVEY